MPYDPALIKLKRYMPETKALVKALIKKGVITDKNITDELKKIA